MQAAGRLRGRGHPEGARVGLVLQRVAGRMQWQVREGRGRRSVAVTWRRDDFLEWEINFGGVPDAGNFVAAAVVAVAEFVAVAVAVVFAAGAWAEERWAEASWEEGPHGGGASAVGWDRWGADLGSEVGRAEEPEVWRRRVRRWLVICRHTRRCQFECPT